jgi:predicted NAD/FAD-binding protein
VEKRDARLPQVAVVGSGVAGLTAAWELSKWARVLLLEADDRLGGHADTHQVTDRDGRRLAVDTGFIVHNRRTYPTLLRLFDELGIETQESDMSMSVRCAGCGLEYAGARGLRGLLARPRSLVRGRYLRMLTEIPRFHRLARRLLESDLLGPGPTLAEFLDEGGFSTYFRQHFAAPLIAAVWSTPAELTGRYPARYLFTFLAHHGMLSITGSPQWWTVTGGSHAYVDRIAAALDDIRLDAAVCSVRRTATGVRLQDVHNSEYEVDGAVLATHPHQALAMLDAPTAAQREILGAITYTPNDAVLHNDPRHLPRASGARASWNYRMSRCEQGAEGVRMTYDMNRLQRLDSKDSWLVSLGGCADISADRIVARRSYEHPRYTPESVAAIARLDEIDGDALVFAGAYAGWGFHEDGARSGYLAAEKLRDLLAAAPVEGAA